MEHKEEFIEHKEFSTLTEVDEEGESSEDPYLDLDYHERYLYDLFGKSVAESYLHPIIDVSVGIVGMSAKLQSTSTKKSYRHRKRGKNETQSLEKIRNDATKLWEMLRENTNQDIKQIDNRIPKSLKQTFNSFARGFIERDLSPPQRTFIEDSDLVKFQQAKNNKKLEESDLIKRQKRLMMNLAKVQEDNQNVLCKEKSFLATREFSGTLKELYFPSLVDVEDELPDNWLSKSHEQLTSKQIMENLDIPIINERELFHAKSASAQSKNLKFWTEQESQQMLRNDLGFRRRLLTHQQQQQQQPANNKQEMEDPVMTHVVQQTRRWQDADYKVAQKMHAMSTPTASPPLAPLSKCSPGEVEDKQQQRNKNKSTGKKPNKYLPLTLAAVIDFKVTRKPTFDLDNGTDGFRQGAAKLWRPKYAVLSS